MATNETTLTIVGNLVDVPDLRFIASGAAMARFTVASTSRVFDKSTGQYRDGDPLFMPCTAWRELATNAAESLTKGARVIVSGRLRLSRWETDSGEKRSMMQLDVDELGPSLRFATATVKKLARHNGNGNGAGDVGPDDPWATASRTRPDPAASDGFDDEPPF
jgi:single-strand DNA-binding protein